MVNTYDETFTLRPRDCDLNEKWRPSAILETMQDTAGAHSILLGCGRDELIRKNMVWVIARCEVHMDRYPAAGEQITVHTFPTPTRICFFPRYYVFTDARGEMIGKAGTLWLLLDVTTRRMLPPGDVGKLIPDNKDLSVPMNLPATVGNLQGDEFVSEYRPVYTDLDVNGHVNNTRYADWLCNTLGIDLRSLSRSAARFGPGTDVHFMHPRIRPVPADAFLWGARRILPSLHLDNLARKG